MNIESKTNSVTIKSIRIILLLFASFIIMSYNSCEFIGKEDIYVGGWKERHLSFVPALSHLEGDNDYYSEIISYKYAGNIAAGWKEKYNWLRNPQNLAIVFNTAKIIGFEKLMSKKKYFSPVAAEFLAGEWEGKSLNQIVKDFLQSDTSISVSGGKYYNEFWARRMHEGNSKEVYTILKEVDAFYNGLPAAAPASPGNDTLQRLLEYDYKLKSADSADLRPAVYDYFNYLKQIGLQHSAYDLVYYGRFGGVTAINADSAIKTLSLDTIPYEVWSATRHNTNGWIDNSMYEGP